MISRSLIGILSTSFLRYSLTAALMVHRSVIHLFFHVGCVLLSQSFSPSDWRRYGIWQKNVPLMLGTKHKLFIIGWWIYIYHHQTHTNKRKKFRLLDVIGRILLSINHHKIFMNTNTNIADATWLIWKYFQMNQDASLALHACEWVVSQKCYHQ